jgi:hypothetical protein
LSTPWAAALLAASPATFMIENDIYRSFRTLFFNAIIPRLLPPAKELILQLPRKEFLLIRPERVDSTYTTYILY